MKIREYPRIEQLHENDSFIVETVAGGTRRVETIDIYSSADESIQDALLGDLHEVNETTDDSNLDLADHISDNTQIVCAYNKPDKTKGAVYKRKLSTIWDYIKGKISGFPALYQIKTVQSDNYGFGGNSAYRWDISISTISGYKPVAFINYSAQSDQVIAYGGLVVPGESRILVSAWNHENSPITTKVIGEVLYLREKIL